MTTFSYSSSLPYTGQASGDAANAIINAFSYISTYLNIVSIYNKN